jgi:hypothetical protein
MDSIDKETTRAFGKRIYLLGIDKNDCYFWLEEPSFDCGWYWGFGYIEKYTNNNPSIARDIISHSHFKGEIIGEQEIYNSKMGGFQKGEYKYHLNEHDLKASVLSDDESWKLSELMNSFYLLSEVAGFFHRGGSHISENPLISVLKDENMYRKINEVLIPKIFVEIDKLLKSNKEEPKTEQYFKDKIKYN